MELNANNVFVTLNNNDIPVLVDCRASWCGPCLQFALFFEHASKELEPRLRLARLNTEKEQAIASQ